MHAWSTHSVGSQAVAHSSGSSVSRDHGCKLRCISITPLDYLKAMPMAYELVPLQQYLLPASLPWPCPLHSSSAAVSSNDSNSSNSNSSTSSSTKAPLSLRTGVPHLLQRLVPHTTTTTTTVTASSSSRHGAVAQQQQQLLCAAKAGRVFAGLTVGVVHTSARSAAEWAEILKTMGATVACQLAPDSSSSIDSNSSVEKLSNAVIDAHLNGLHCIISDHPQLWTEPVPLTDGSVPGLSYISQASHSYCNILHKIETVTALPLQGAPPTPVPPPTSFLKAVVRRADKLAVVC
eukprot:5601-Heterococcus_DN1.PRE.1